MDCISRDPRVAKSQYFYTNSMSKDIRSDSSELQVPIVLDSSITMESVQWLLAENLKAGTMALFWCLKSQFLKVKARLL